MEAAERECTTTCYGEGFWSFGIDVLQCRVGRMRVAVLDAALVMLVPGGCLVVAC
jgi:hypothetical protein